MRGPKPGWFVAAVLAAVVAVSLVASGVAVAQQTGGGVPAVTPRPASEAAPAVETAGQEMKSGLNSTEGAAPPAGATGSGLAAVMAVTLIIWIGLFLYVLRLDRKVRRLEEP